MQRGVGRCQLHLELAESPLAVVALERAERLPERRQVGRVLDDQLVLGHLVEALGDGADARTLTFEVRDDAARVVGVDDARAAVAHAGAGMEHLGVDDLDARDVGPGIDDHARVDHRVGHRLQIGAARDLQRRVGLADGLVAGGRAARRGRARLRTARVAGGLLDLFAPTLLLDRSELQDHEVELIPGQIDPVFQIHHVHGGHRVFPPARPRAG